MAEHDLTVYVVSHTHWDREWYEPAGRFRQRLVALIDEVIGDPPIQGDSFLLDGQAVVLEDYLAVRPERRDELAALLRSGVVEAGPWYVLADELIPSGEALVRNLLAGRDVLSALGATAPPVLYSPDAFGHPASFPSLARGFGCGLIILWRGYGGPAWPSGDTVRWRANDGATVLLYHLPPDGYEFGASLPPADDAARERWGRVGQVLGPRAVLGIALLANGADHHARQRDRTQALVALATAAAPALVRASSLARFAESLEQRARGAALPGVTGELRASYGYTWTLQGTFATRAHQKRMNATVERTLVRDAEPWAALAARHGARDRRDLLRAAWKSLLRCHPHDTLCGCSIDQVARAMDARLEDAFAQAAGVRHDSLDDLVGHDPAVARERRSEWAPCVIVRNGAPRARGGIVELDVVRTKAHVRVGPGSGREAEPAQLPPAFSLWRDGVAVPVQILDRTIRHDRIDSPLDYPDDALVESAHAVAWVAPVGGLGTAALSIRGETGDAQAPSVVRAGERWMENEWLRVSVDDEGAVRVASPSTGMTVASALAIEDVGDGGDLYTPSPRGATLRAERLDDVCLTQRGPLRAELTGRFSLDVPVSLAPGRDTRSAEPRALSVHVALTLDTGARFVRVRMEGDNACRDHRLRIVFRTGLAGAATFADAAFGPVARTAITAPPGSGEVPPPTAPLARYVTRDAGTRGITVYADGLAESESIDDGGVAITLVRAVGELSRSDLPERPGHAGWPSPTPEAQCLRPFEGRFAMMMHGAREAAVIDLIERTCDDVLVPPVGLTLRAAVGTPRATMGVELDGAGLAFLACKPSEDGGWMVLRCVNLLDRAVAGAWRCGFPVRQAMRARLDETPVAAADEDAGGVRFQAGPREIVTM
ncbi:MAG: glycosyl hydrolase-related protein, partial [Gemmatimonadaceae bacterium]